MNSKTIETLKVLSFVLVIIYATIITFQWVSKIDHVPLEKVDELVDERTRVQSASIKNRDEIIESITRASASMASRINDLEEEVVILTEASGRLNLYRDSLKTLQKRLSIADLTFEQEDGTLAFRDTTITHISTFSDSLFEVRCFVSFSSSGCITLDSELKQLRDTKIVYAVTDRGLGYLNAYLHLPDFDVEETLQFTYQPDPILDSSFWEDLRPYVVTGSGIVLVYLILQLFL